MDVVIDMSGVRKRFGSVEVLKGLDLQVRPGEVHAFLGANGAGKTTTLRLLLGLLRADAGTMSVLGMDPWRHPAELHRRLAYVPGEVSLWPNLSGGEVIDLLCRLRGGADRARRDELVEMFDLDPRKRCRTYSKGNRQKVALIAALAVPVPLYLLDEPTAGLDPVMDATFRSCVRRLRGEGATILLSSHILSEAEALSDRVSILRGGVVVESGALSDLRHLTRSSVTAEVAAVPVGIAALPGVHEVRTTDLPDGRARVSAQVDSDGTAPLLAALAGAGVSALVSAPPTLEQLFLRHYAGEYEVEDSGVGAR